MKKWDRNLSGQSIKTMPKNSKKPTRSKLIKKLDVVFSQYIRRKYSDNRGFVQCFTCETKKHWKEMQCGHFRSRRFYATRWCEDNVRVQCPRCNVFEYGRAYEFGRKLGDKLAEEMYLKSQSIVKFTNTEINDMIDLYASKLKRM